MLTRPGPNRRVAGKALIAVAAATALPVTASWATRYVDVAAPPATFAGAEPAAMPLPHASAVLTPEAAMIATPASANTSEPAYQENADGSVTLALPAEFSAELDAESADGAVRASHPAVTGARDHSDGRAGESRRSLRTTLGSGGRTLRVRTGDGSIRIQR